MQSQSHHSKLANMVGSPTITQKSFNHYNQFSGIKQNGFQAVQSPKSNIVNSVNISTRFK